MKRSVLFVVLLATGHSIFAAQNDGVGKRCIHLAKACVYGTAGFVAFSVAAVPVVVTMVDGPLDDAVITIGTVACFSLYCSAALSCCRAAREHCSKACKIKTEQGAA